MNLNHLRAFYDVALSGSVSAASRRLRITQPALSRAVRQLEDALGSRLFDRQPRGIRLTAEGRRVFERCQTIFRECAAIGADSSADVLRLAVAASENLCLHVFPAILAAPGVRAGHAKLEAELTSGTSEQVLREVLGGQAELGYCYHPARVNGVGCEPIAEVPFELVVGPQQPRRRRTLRGLAGLPFIGSRTRDYPGVYRAWSLQSGLGLRGLKVAAASLQSNSQETQVAMAMAGLGYTIVPWFVVRSKVLSGKLVRIPTSPPLTSPLYRISRLDRELPSWQPAFEAALIRGALAGSQRPRDMRQGPS